MSSKRFFVRAAPAVILTILLAAASSALTLSHWDDQVQVSGSMTMGHLEWDVNYAASSRDWNTNTVMSFFVHTPELGDGPEATGVVEIYIQNAYPNGYGVIMVVVENEGTIPVHVKVWVEPAGSCELLDYVMLNPSYDVAYYSGGEFNYGEYELEDIDDGWNDDWTQTVSWWVEYHGSPDNAIAVEDIMVSGNVLKLPNTDTTIMEYDNDNIIMPGEQSVFFVWLGISEDLQEREDLMGVSCSPAFYIHYVATQAVP